MSQSVVSVCNLALAKVGAARISSITQDTRSAILLNSIFESKRDEVLRRGKWKFATKRAELAPNSNTPDFEYDYEYDLPNDYLGPVDTYPDTVDYVIENGKILSNEDTLDFAYIYRVTDPAAWDTSFCEALACALAAEAAYALTQSVTLADKLEKEAERKLKIARSRSGMEGVRKDFAIETWTGSRRSMGSAPKKV